MASVSLDDTPEADAPSSTVQRQPSITMVDVSSLELSSTHDNNIDHMKETWRSCLRPSLGEVVSMGLMVFVACGAGANTAQFYNPGPIAITIALASGFTVMVLLFTFGHISGAHFNPVITVVFMLLKKISMVRGVMYLVAQVIGSLIGTLLLRACTPQIWHNASTGLAVPNCLAANMLAPGIPPSVAFLTEMILTFFLLMCVCAATDSNKSNQTLIPVAVGCCVACMVLVALPIDGGSFNPTRSFTAALLARATPGCENVWDNHWIYWFGPFIGGIAGGFLYSFVFHDGGTYGENLMKQFLRERPERRLSP